MTPYRISRKSWLYLFPIFSSITNLMQSFFSEWRRRFVCIPLKRRSDWNQLSQLVFPRNPALVVNKKQHDGCCLRLYSNANVVTVDCNGQIQLRWQKKKESIITSKGIFPREFLRFLKTRSHWKCSAGKNSDTATCSSLSAEKLRAHSASWELH